MGGFNPAWFIAVAVGVVLAVATASSLPAQWSLGLWVVAAVCFLVGVVGLMVDFHRSYELRLPFASRQTGNAARGVEPLTFHDLLESHIHDRSIYISDLARVDAVVRDKIFTNVTFVGPAVISFIDNDDVREATWDAGGGPLEAILLEVPVGTKSVGVIGFYGCTFRNCRFVRVQVMGTKKDIDKLRETFVNQGH